MRIQDLPGWVPIPGGPMPPGGRVPTTADQVYIERVIAMFHDHLVFTCKFEGESVSYSFAQLDEKTGEKVAAIVNDHIGQPLLSIAALEIPED